MSVRGGRIGMGSDGMGVGRKGRSKKEEIISLIGAEVEKA